MAPYSILIILSRPFICIYIRSKAYRVKLWFTEDSTLAKAIIFLIASGPSEQLLQRLQWLDDRGGILRDIFHCTESSSDPFLGSLVSYAEMLLNPLLTPAWLLFKQFECQGAAVVQLVFEAYHVAVLDLGAKLWLQWMRVSGWPNRLVGLVAHGRGTKEETAKALYDTSLWRHCCLDESMTAKVRRMAPTWQELLNHRGLMAALTTWSWVAKLSNMHLERLLALIRKSAPQRCFLERLLATGHLTQILSRHRSAGGSDIRRITRKQLVQLSVPIRATSKVLKKKNKPKQTLFAKWAATRWKDKEGRASRQEYRARMKTLAAEYHALGYVPIIPEEPAADPGGQTYADRIQTCLGCCSSEATPLRDSILQEEIDVRIPANAAGKLGGLTERLAPIREAVMAGRFVKESGALPSKDKYEIRESCRAKHPDICAVDLQGNISKAWARTLSILAKVSACSFIAFRVSGPEDVSALHYKCLARCHQSRQNVAVILLACDDVDGRLCLRGATSIRLAWETGQAALARVWREDIRLDMLVYVRGKASNMQEAISLLPAEVPSTYQEFVIWPLPVATDSACEVDKHHFSDEAMELQALAKQLKTITAAFQFDEPQSEDEDAATIATLEASLGKMLKVVRGKAQRKRVAAKAKLLAKKKPKPSSAGLASMSVMGSLCENSIIIIYTCVHLCWLNGYFRYTIFSCCGRPIFTYLHTHI